MASYINLANGKVRAHICVNKQRETKTFPNKQKAKSWVREREYQIQHEKSGNLNESITVKKLFQLYARKVSPKKKGAKKEILCLTRLESYTQLSSIHLQQLSREHLESWIEFRLQSVKGSSVNRELNLISHCLTYARRWKYMEHNPFKDLIRPKDEPPRFRRIDHAEIQQLNLVMGYRPDIALQYKYQFAALAFHFAIETAMRAGEICALTKNMINDKARVITLPAHTTKNGYARDIPLSSHALHLLNQLPEVESLDQPIFQLNSAQLDANFRKYRDKTTIENLTFHDTRHEAITRLAEKLEVLELARVVGHRDIKQLMVYYNKTAAELAQKLG